MGLSPPLQEKKVDGGLLFPYFFVRAISYRMLWVVLSFVGCVFLFFSVI